MKITARTAFRNIIQDSSTVEVKAASFRFINAGNLTVFINDVPLMPGASLGDDSSIVWSNLLATNPGTTIERHEHYTITFKLGLGTGPDTNSGDPGYPSVKEIDRRPRVILVETFYTVEK